MDHTINIPFHRPYITQEGLKSVVEALKNGWLTMGPRTMEFERQFKEHIGAKYCIAVNSCTAGLHLALDAIGLKENDEVIVPAITFPSTSAVVCYFKAKPVFVDVEINTHNIDAGKIEEAINRKTKAIMPVHFAGQAADMDRILYLSKKYNLRVIEDSAHAFPASYKGRNVGTIGDLTCFSFYATKTITTGEGGMIATANKKWADRMKIMRLHAMNRDAWKRYSKGGSWYYQVLDAGFKYNMTDVEAALGISQLKIADYMRKKRQVIASAYNEAFSKVSGIIIPHIKEDRVTAWHLYVIKLDLGVLKIDRNRFINELNKRGIGASVHFIPLYRHEFYKKNFSFRKIQFPNSEWLYKRVISLPIYSTMTKLEIGRVISAVRDITKKNRR